MANTKDKPKAGVDYLPAGEIYEKVLADSKAGGDSFEKDPDGYMVRLTNRFAEAYRTFSASPRPDTEDTPDGENQDPNQD